MSRIIRSLSPVLVVLAVLSALLPGRMASAQDAQTPAEICAAATANVAEPETREFAAAEEVLEDGVDYWTVLCTAAGPIYLDLYEAESPLTVNNFVFLAGQGFFNNTTFHRVLPGFMAQGGDPSGTGSGGPGYTFEDETANGLVFDTYGLLAMANAGANTNGSQFFLTTAPTAWLNGNHTIFGRVYEGIERVELLTPRDPEYLPSYDGTALETVVIVEDPASIAATPDGPPAISHFQAVLLLAVPLTLNEQFVVDADLSQEHDLEAEAAYWGGQGEGLEAAMHDYLSGQGFVGAAAIVTALSECPEDPATLPIWGVGLRVLEFGDAETAQAVVFDDARAALLTEAGAFDEYSDPAEFTGRVFSHKLAEGTGCGASSTAYRLEFPYGRYVVVTELTLDDAFIGPETEPTAAQYLAFVLEDLLFGTLGGTLDRGNADLAE
ncbi:MAG: peptidylprolyl isomerase [Anaerolineae bacterium]|nr:peptidylprolyl isomerase [Anaerolineae bacterium]